MGKFKRWLCNKFLPAYCRDALLEENARLRELVSDYQKENARLRSYIDGMDAVLRRQRRIVINNGEVSK